MRSLMNRIFSGFLVLAMLFSPCTGFAGTTNFDSVTIGSATDTQTLTLNGTAYTSLSLGSDGNFSSAAGVLTADLAPTKFIFTASSGDLSVTGATIGTGDVTFAQGGKIDGDTDNEIRLIENSDTLKIGFSGDDITLDTTDGGVIFALTDATDGKVLFKTNNDTDDYMIVSTAANVPTISTLGTSNLIIAPDGGDTQITGTATISGLATAAGVTTSSTITLQNSETIVNSTNGTVQIGGSTSTILSVLDTGTGETDATLLLRNDNSTDNGDDWEMQSDGTTDSLLFNNDTSGSQATILTLANTGLLTTTGDVTVAGTTPLVTIGDGGDEDAGIQLNSDTTDFYIASENTLDAVQIGVGSSIGTTPIYTGLLASTTITGGTDGDLIIHAAGTTNSDAYLRLVGDAGADAGDRAQLFHDSSAATTYFQIDSGVAGTYVTKLSIAGTGAAVLHGTTDGDFTVYGDGTTASDAKLHLVGDAQTDASDSGEIWMDSSAGTIFFGIDDTTPGTYVTKASLDSTGAFTVQGSEGTAGSIAIWSDNGDDATDKVTLSVADAGALTVTTGSNTLFVGNADGSTTFSGDVGVSGTTPLLTVGDGGDEDAGVQINSDTADYYIASENSVDKLIIGSGSAIGTTPALTVGSSGDVTISKMFVLPTYAAAAMPASAAASAASGAVVAIHDARSTLDCGNIGGGTFTNVCLSNGTNWIDL